MTDREDTIAAVATPPGTGGIAVIRISGSCAENVLSEVFSKGAGAPSNQMVYGRVIDADGGTIDTGYAVLFRDRSYTGEPTAELHVHGGAVNTKRVLGRVLEAGARPADPGEFTMRAFMNGRMDLSQAEAVGDLIGALSEAGAKLAVQQADGAVANVVGQVQRTLLEMTAHIEAMLEYPDEDIDEPYIAGCRDTLLAAKETVERLAGTARTGTVIKEGLHVVLAGAPNAGKSSLFNALCGSSRAIVTSTPGTTRDQIEQQISIGGAAVLISDTAGLRQTKDDIEREGVIRSRAAVRDSGLMLFVVDQSENSSASAEDAWRMVADSASEVVCVLNKSDLSTGTSLDLSFLPENTTCVKVSAKTGAGIGMLRQLLYDHTCADRLREETPMVSSLRQEKHLREAAALVDSAVTALDEGVDLDLISIDLRDACTALGYITGTAADEELIDTIFSKFCLGK